MTVAAIVAAGGRGERLGRPEPKALVFVGGRTPLEHAVDGLRAAGVTSLVIVVPADHVAAVAMRLPDVTVVAGGATRQESVRRGLAVLDADADIVLVHDAARAFAPAEMVGRVIDAVRSGADAVVPVLPVTDTIKQVVGADVVATVDRSALRAVQTPQGFRREVLEQAHRRGDAAATDDAALVEASGGTVRVIEGAATAFKVTTEFDLVVAEALLAQRSTRV